MKRIIKFLTADESSLIPLNESLRIGINDKPENTMDYGLEIYNILTKKFVSTSDTIIFDDEYIDVKNVLESMYEYRFECVGKRRTRDAMQVLNQYEKLGFSTQFDNYEYIKAITSVELYNLKLNEENRIKEIISNLEFNTIDTKKENIKFHIYEDDKLLLCYIVQQENKEQFNIDELLLVIK